MKASCDLVFNMWFYDYAKRVLMLLISNEKTRIADTLYYNSNPAARWLAN